MPRKRQQAVADNEKQNRRIQKQHVRKARFQNAKPQPISQEQIQPILKEWPPISRKRRRAAARKAKRVRRAANKDILEKLGRLNMRSSSEIKPKVERTRNSAGKEMEERFQRLKLRNSSDVKPNIQNNSSELWQRRLRPRNSSGSVDRPQPLAIHTNAPWLFNDKQGKTSAGSSAMDMSTGESPGTWLRRQFPNETRRSLRP